MSEEQTAQVQQREPSIGLAEDDFNKKDSRTTGGFWEGYLLLKGVVGDE